MCVVDTQHKFHIFSHSNHELTVFTALIISGSTPSVYILLSYMFTSDFEPVPVFAPGVGWILPPSLRAVVSIDWFMESTAFWS